MESAPLPQIKTTYEQEQSLPLTRTAVRDIRCDQDCAPSSSIDAYTGC